MNNVKRKGVTTELQCIAEFSKYSDISLPYGDNCKYDFIADIDGKLIRVQCKTAQYCSRNDSIVVPTRKTRVNSNTVFQTTYNSKQIDCFATYWDSVCYVIPISEAENRVVFTLRASIPKNNQQTKIHFLSDYTLEHYIQMLS